MVRQAQMTESKRVKDFRLGLATQIPKFPNNRASLRVLQGQAAWAAADRLRQLAHQIGSAAPSREGHRSPRAGREGQRLRWGQARSPAQSKECVL
jgi:hypothetical protein